MLKWGEGEGSRRNGEAREGEKNKGGLSFSREFRGADDVLIVRVEGGRCGSVPVVWQYDLFKQLLSAHEKKELQAEDLDGTTAFFFRKFSREVRTHDPRKSPAPYSDTGGQTPELLRILRCPDVSLSVSILS